MNSVSVQIHTQFPYVYSVCGGVSWLGTAKQEKSPSANQDGRAHPEHKNQ